MMPDWLWLKFLAVVTILISCIPWINFWHIVFGSTGFRRGRDLLVYTLFKSAFSLAIYYIIVINLKLSQESPSFLILLACIQLLFFTFLAATLPVTYGTTHLINKFFQIKRFPKYTVKNRFLRMISTYYISGENTDENYFLTSEFSLLYLLFCYIFSGIITASSVGNQLIILLTNMELKFNSANPSAQKATDAILAIYNTDLQLYKDLFLLSVIPIAIQQLIHAFKHK